MKTTRVILVGLSICCLAGCKGQRTADELSSLDDSTTKITNSLIKLFDAQEDALNFVYQKEVFGDPNKRLEFTVKFDSSKASINQVFLPGVNGMFSPYSSELHDSCALTLAQMIRSAHALASPASVQTAIENFNKLNSALSTADADLKKVDTTAASIAGPISAIVGVGGKYLMRGYQSSEVKKAIEICHSQANRLIDALEFIYITRRETYFARLTALIEGGQDNTPVTSKKKSDLQGQAGTVVSGNADSTPVETKARSQQAEDLQTLEKVGRAITRVRASLVLERLRDCIDDIYDYAVETSDQSVVEPKGLRTAFVDGESQEIHNRKVNLLKAFLFEQFDNSEDTIHPYGGTAAQKWGRLDVDIQKLANQTAYFSSSVDSFLGTLSIKSGDDKNAGPK